METLNFTGIELYPVFISYSTQDQEFAERLHADLQDKDVRCWFASHDLRGGKKVHREIDEAVRSHDRVPLIISETSMASEWMRTVIAIARKRKVEQEALSLNLKTALEMRSEWPTASNKNGCKH